MHSICIVFSRVELGGPQTVTCAVTQSRPNKHFPLKLRWQQFTSQLQPRGCCMQQLGPWFCRIFFGSCCFSPVLEQLGDFFLQRMLYNALHCQWSFCDGLFHLWVRIFYSIGVGSSPRTAIPAPLGLHIIHSRTLPIAIPFGAARLSPILKLLFTAVTSAILVFGERIRQYITILRVFSAVDIATPARLMFGITYGPDDSC